MAPLHFGFQSKSVLIRKPNSWRYKFQPCPKKAESNPFLGLFWRWMWRGVGCNNGKIRGNHVIIRSESEGWEVRMGKVCVGSENGKRSGRWEWEGTWEVEADGDGSFPFFSSFSSISPPLSHMTLSQQFDFFPTWLAFILLLVILTANKKDFTPLHTSKTFAYGGQSNI